MDEIQPYRLEMSTSLKISSKTKNLYGFWGEAITHRLDEMVSGHEHPYIINLASSEYFKAVKTDKLKAGLINCIFMDWKKGQFQVVMTWAKLARGMMAREIVRNKLDTPEQLKEAGFNGYTFNKQMSSKKELVFTRKQA
jgi:cytoplasmic iron level regulating protein YaaA (DUF328/UPF0246 family)